MAIQPLSYQRIPAHQHVRGVTALTSLLALGDGNVLVGTTTSASELPVLLHLDPWTGTVRDTGMRFEPKGQPGQRTYGIGDKIHDALILGTGRWAGWCLMGHGSHIWWDEGGWPFSPQSFAGGAIYAWHPQTGEQRCLGVPVPNNTVHGLYGGDGFAVGYSLPDNHFFAIDYDSGDRIDLGRISAYCCHGFICHGRRAYGVYRRSIGPQRGDLVVADDAAAYLLVYDHDRRALDRTDIRISELETNIRFNSGIDGWVAGFSPNTVLGGRVNGTLFELDTVDRSIRELGHAVAPLRPALDPHQLRRLGGRQCRRIQGCERIPAMARLNDRQIIGAAGFPVMHLFLLDDAGQCTDRGPVNPRAEMCYFHSLAVARRGDDYRIVLAETDSPQADLYVTRGPVSISPPQREQPLVAHH